jgi:hypothetical protein
MEGMKVPPVHVSPLFFKSPGLNYLNRHDARRPQAYNMKFPVKIFILHDKTDPEKDTF